MGEVNTIETPKIELPPYLPQLVRHLKTEERDVWSWFNEHRDRNEASEAARLELLKSTYRIDRESNPTLYETADDVASTLQIDARVTIYQAQDTGGLNAGMARIFDAPHVILFGPLLERLSEDELRAILSHELSHYVLWRGWSGDYRVAEDVLTALCNQENPHLAHGHTLRLFGLYTEIFCDRGALSVVQDPDAVITSLLKTTTGLEQVSAKAYLEQAEEIFQQQDASTAGITHPEAFIRARAVKLSSDRDADVDATIARMIEGRLVLGELDLLGQRRVSDQTRQLIDAVFAHKSLRTDAMLGQARAYFAKYQAPEAKQGSRIESIAAEHESIQDYFVYVLLDFATADAELEELPLAVSLRLSQELGIESRFAELAQKEMRLRKKQMTDIAKNLDRVLGGP